MHPQLRRRRGPIRQGVRELQMRGRDQDTVLCAIFTAWNDTTRDAERVLLVLGSRALHAAYVLVSMANIFSRSCDVTSIGDDGC